MKARGPILRRACTLALAAVLLLAPLGCQPRRAVAAEQASDSLFAWCEINPADPASYERGLAGAGVWATLVDRVCLMSSGQPQGAEWWAMVRRDAPNVALLPGVKTNGWLKGNLGNVAGWQAIAEQVRTAVDACGWPECLLENESAEEPLIAGQVMLEEAKLRRGLRLLPADVRIFWYRGHVAPYNARQHRLLEIVAEELSGRVEFLTAGWIDQVAESDADRLTCLAKDEALAPVIALALMYPPAVRPNDWRPAQVRDLAGRISAPRLIFYPGNANWLAAGQATVHAWYAAADDDAARLLPWLQPGSGPGWIQLPGD